ncbi:hypothetical protein RRG08_032117 [Elysia crispata]|uniref:Uncharacterized protein n=1 Tax=Elysia crispata TaxID=231223 RepID=A0AAE0ZFJ4_9GAST|nr:hypothetical protein RRG08_032117 [Elysia crispata]
MITVLMLTHLWLKIKGVRNLGQTSSSPKAIINIAVIQEGFFDLETNMESVYLVVPLTPFFLWGSSFSVCVVVLTIDLVSSLFLKLSSTLTPPTTLARRSSRPASWAVWSVTRSLSGYQWV